MDITETDVVVIGAGIAGSTAAAHIAADHRVVLVEAEEVAGYHTTGRSAAIWIQNYGTDEVRVLTGLSRAFFENPPEGFADVPLMSHRPVWFIASSDERAELKQMLAEGVNLRKGDPEAMRHKVPAIRPGSVVGVAVEDEAFDMDAAALHQGFLRTLRRRGGTLRLRARAGRIERRNGQWEVEVTGGDVVRAPVVVNAAGAWGDEVAAMAGVNPLGLQPKRRTAAVINPAPWNVADWPMVHDIDHGWYARPEPGNRLMVSPCDETDMEPCDVQPDELDVAICIDRMQQTLDIEVKRVERSWAGLRTFTPDRNFAFGFDAVADGFFWNVGQGGYGIQTAPAAGQLVADLVAGRDPGEAGPVVAQVAPSRFSAAG